MGSDMRFFNNAVSTSKTGICPNCHAVRNLRVHIEYEQGIDGTTTREVRAAHCESCGSFVSRESHKLRQKDSWGQV